MKFLCPPLKIQSVLLVSMFLLAKAGAQTPDPSQAAEADNPSQAADTPQPYSITDLGTLGGSTSAAAGMAGQQGHNAAGMIVGTSTASDNTAHAFLYSNGQMRDLNELCDLSTSDFNVLTTASSIDDAGQIIGAGITAKGQTHAFLLKPTPVDGGQWSYSCCQWIWKQGSTDSSTNNNSGWWWESSCHCYKWHGPPGKHPPCPPNPPHCWGWPLPCSTDMGCSPYAPGPHPNPKVTPTPTPTVTPTPTPTPNNPAFCWCCVKGNVSHISDILCRARGGQCFATQGEAGVGCAMGWCCEGGVVSQTSREACKKVNGLFYDSEAEAKINCQGYCCLNNSFTTATMPECLLKGGTYWPTYHQLLENCGPTCWCCDPSAVSGQIMQMPRTDCIQSGETCHETLGLAKADCPGAKVVPLDDEKISFPSQNPPLHLPKPGPIVQPPPAITPKNPRIPNTGQLQPLPTPEVTPFRRRQSQLSPTPTPNSGRTPSRRFLRGTPSSTPKPTPRRQPELHRSLNKPKPTPTPPIVR